jgi:hypothetical protein
MKPTDALEIQHDYKWKCGDANFRLILDNMIMARSGMKHKPNKIQKIIDITPQQIVNTYLSSAINVGVSNTPCYFVKDEMTDLIMFASQKLDDTDLFDTSFVPSDKGFVYFEKPLEVRDVRGRTLLGNVVVWEKGFSQGKHGIIVSIFNDAKRTPDEIASLMLSDADKNAQRNLDVIGRFHWIHSFNLIHGEVVGEAVKVPSEEEVEEMRNMVFSETGNELIELDDEAWEKYKQEKITPYTNIRRLVHAYFLIMSQTLTAKTTERGDRAQRRRLERENLPSEVLVIQFRKTRYTSAEGGEERNVNWSHRWIVGGHWRWQPYKDPASGGEIKKRIWISPYVKGPDDKPLKTKERVYVLAR